MSLPYQPVQHAVPDASVREPAYAYPRDDGRSREGYLLKIALLALFSWSLLGKKCMLTMAVWLSVPPRLLTIPSHAITVGLALGTIALVVFASRGGGRSYNWALVPYIAFWGIYSFRIFAEYAASDMLGAPPPDATYSVSYVTQRTFGSCVLPSLALLLNLQWGFHRQTRILCMGTALVIAVAFLAMFRDNIFSFQHRMQPGDESGDFTTISSLQMGYAGLGLFTFVIFGFFADMPRRLPRLAFLLAAGAVSLLLLVGSASRGPVIAAAFIMIPFAASLYARGQRTRFLQLTVAGFLVGVAALAVAEATGSSLFDRLFSLHEDIQNQSAQADRLRFYRAALAAFWEAPIFGLQTTLEGSAYPHNLFLESLMATGIAGTLPLCVLTIYAIVCAWRILVRAPELGWLSLNFFAALCGAMFSGAIFTNSGLWICMAGTISASQWLRSEPPADEDPE